MGRRGSSGGGGARARMSSSQVTSALREAQDLQQEGRLDEAIEICEELLESGVERSDVHYFLGWLFQEADRWDDASAQFERLLEDPDYALSCCYALGQCARALGNVQDAAHYFDEAVDRVNLDALTREESDQLLQLCQEAAEAHRDMNDAEGAETIYSALLGFLRSQGWQDQVSEIERMMRETLGTSAPPQSQRRRRSASASRSLSENIPQRKGGSSSANASPFNDGGVAGVPPMDPTMALDDGAGFMSPPAPMPPMSPTMAPGANSGALGLGAAASFGAVAMVPPVGGGMGTLVGGSPVGAGGAAAPGDHLAQLINSLSGPAAGMRAGLASLPEPYRSQVAQAVREIENYVAHGLLTAAIEECMRVMEIAPQYLDVHLLLGEIYVRQGKIEQAIAKYAILVDTYMVSGRMDDAIATYRRILQLEPNNLTYRVKLIELLSRQGRTEEALSERMLAADSYLRMGYADRAIQEYEQALLAYPNNTQVRLNYAAALMKAGRASQAVSEYQRVLQVDPTNTIALARWQIAQATGIGVASAISTPGASVGAGGVGANRVAALEALTRLLRALKAENQRTYDDVTREYVQALDATPGSADLRYALGAVHLAANRQQEAVTCFQQVIPAPGMEVLARYASGQAFLLTGDPANAAIAVRELEEAAAAVRRQPPEPSVWAARPRAENEERLAPEVEVSMLLARAYQMAGQVAQMQATLQSVSEQRPYNDEVYRVLAEVSARQSDPQAQLQEYAQLVRQYRANRQLENAVAVLKEMERVAPDEPAVRAELADVHITRGLLDEGQAELKALADIHTRRGQLREAAQVYQRMAEISWTSGAQEEALAQLRQAIQFSTDEMSLRHQFVQYCLEIGRNADAAEQQTVLARFYFASRQTKEAVAALQQLIAMDKHNYEAYDLLGQTYYSVGEYEQAARVYRNLAKVDPNSLMARARLQELQAVRAQMG